jgi:GntR family transcriptional regulator/MocR family aminotransferase
MRELEGFGHIVVADTDPSKHGGASGTQNLHRSYARLPGFRRLGHLDRHIRRIRGIYAEQPTELVNLLNRNLPTSLGRVQASDQGMHMVVWLREGIDDKKIVAAAAEEGVALRPLSPMYARDTERSGLIPGFGGFSVRQLEVAVARLVHVIHAGSDRDVRSSPFTDRRPTSSPQAV